MDCIKQSLTIQAIRAEVLRHIIKRVDHIITHKYFRLLVSGNRLFSSYEHASQSDVRMAI